MSIIDQIKRQAALYQVNKILKVKHADPQSFSGFFQRSFSFLVMMPSDETDFHYALQVLEFLEERKKHATILTYDYRVSLIPVKFRQNLLEHGIKDMNRLDLPSKFFSGKLSAMRFDVVIDLNREENLFYSLAINLLNAPVKIGITKENSDKYYNLQIANNENNPELFYKNFLNCLEMF